LDRGHGQTLHRCRRGIGAAGGGVELKGGGHRPSIAGQSDLGNGKYGDWGFINTCVNGRGR
jgi:hypothetical protein